MDTRMEGRKRRQGRGEEEPLCSQESLHGETIDKRSYRNDQTETLSSSATGDAHAQVTHTSLLLEQIMIIVALYVATESSRGLAGATIFFRPHDTLIFSH